MKVIYDTCLYIDFLNSGMHEDLFMSRGHIRFLSGIVAMELRAGATKPKQIATLNTLFKPYFKASRVIGYHENELLLAGEILAKIRKKHGNLKAGFSHDVLIALSAVNIGARIFTTNTKDFKLIAGHLPLKLVSL